MARSNYWNTKRVKRELKSKDKNGFVDQKLFRGLMKELFQRQSKCLLSMDNTLLSEQPEVLVFLAENLYELFQEANFEVTDVTLLRDIIKVVPDENILDFYDGLAIEYQQDKSIAKLALLRNINCFRGMPAAMVSQLVEEEYELIIEAIQQ